VASLVTTEAGVTRPRFFKDDATHADRAVQIWQILIGCAARRETITYQGLVRRMGHGQPKVLAKQLGHVLEYCERHGLPPLTVLVVNKNTGLPGEGFPGSEAQRGRVRERVFQFDWYGVYPPTADAFRHAYTES
jgi:putative restriction endonuclease